MGMFFTEISFWIHHRKKRMRKGFCGIHIKDDLFMKKWTFTHQDHLG